MARILLSAYACEPGRGSEPEVGWSWATELARLGHEVTVITREANRSSIEPQLKQLPKHLSFAYYDLPGWIGRVRRFPGGKPLYYALWQWFAVRFIRRRFLSLPFDVVQHVTYVSVRYPSFMGSLGVPFYFGPVSGGEAVPLPLRSGFSLKERYREAVRDVSNRFISRDPLMRRTFEQATRVILTRDTLPLLPRNVRHKATQSLAIGLVGCKSRTHFRSSSPKPRLELLYVGRLLEWKGVDIALRALKMTRQEFPNARLTIVGNGPAKPRLVKLGRDLQLEDAVNWAGWVPQSHIGDCYQKADLFLFPSLRDSGGMVVLEALSHGLPVVCMDLGGPGLIVDHTCGRVIGTNGRTQEHLARDMSDALLAIASSSELLQSLSRGALARAQCFMFEDLVRSVYPSSAQASVVRPA